MPTGWVAGVCGVLTGWVAGVAGNSPAAIAPMSRGIYCSVYKMAPESRDGLWTVYKSVGRGEARQV